MQLPETIYDNTHTWQNANDRVAMLRSFTSADNNIDRKTAQALLTANPLTSNIEIQVNMNQPPMPPRLGIGVEQKGIADILANDINDRSDPVNTSLWNEFAGTNAAYGATERPSLPSVAIW